MAQKTKTEKSGKPFITLSGKSATGWGGLLICSFILFFFIGTLVGRGSIKVDLGQKKLSKEINEYAKSLNTFTSKDVEIIDDTPDLDFYETLPEAGNANIGLQKNISNKPAKKIKKVVKKKVLIKKPALAASANVETKKVEPKKEKKAKAADAKDASIYKYSIQIASFKGLEDAKKTVSKFKQKGYSAYYAKAIVRDQEIWYRVRIGAFKDRIDARATLARLEKNNIDGFLVTR